MASFSNLFNSKNTNGSGSGPVKRIALATPPPTGFAGSRLLRNPTPTNNSARKVKSTEEKKEDEEIQTGWGIKMSAQETLKLYDFAEKPTKIDPRKHDIEELLRNQRDVKPSQKNLMMAFDKNLANDSVVPRFPGFDTSVLPTDDDGPLPSLSELLSSTKVSALQSTDKQCISGQTESLTNLVNIPKSPSELEKAEAEFIKLTDELHKKNIEYLQKFRQQEKESILSSTLTSSVHESFHQVVPVVEKYLTKSAPVNIKTIIQGKKLPGLPCRFEERRQTVKTLEKLVEIGGVAKDFLNDTKEDLSEVLINSVQHNMKTLDEDLNSLELALNGAEENLETANRISQLVTHFEE